MDSGRCPCGTGEVYDECCGPLLDGARAAHSAEQLMRSRFTAFAVGNAVHLLATWHPSTRPATLTSNTATIWTRLEVVRSSGGGSFDQHGVVEFRAHHRTDGVRGSLHEVSSFLREDGRWFYVAGTGTGD